MQKENSNLKMNLMQKLFLHVCKISMLLSVFLTITTTGVFLINFLTALIIKESNAKELLELLYPFLLGPLAFLVGYKLVYRGAA